MSFAQIAAVSYLAGAIAFAMLSVLLLTAWRGRLQGALLVVSSVLTSLWCLASAAYAYDGVLPMWMVYLVEAARDVAWLVFMFGLMSGISSGATDRGRRVPRARVVAAILAGLATAAAVLVGRFSGQVPAESALKLVHIAFLGLSVWVLAAVEQLYRNTRPEFRWRIKFLAVGLGGLFAFDLYFYANGLLFAELDTNAWAARGLVHAMVVPALALAARRNPEWSLNVFVSRHVVFHSAALLSAGIYLLLMAGAGYYIKNFGGTWGGVAQFTFLFGAGLVLAALLLSGALRARLRVALRKHFFANRYDYREEWLRFTRTLSSASSDAELRQNVIKAFADILQSQSGYMWTRGPTGDFRVVAQWLAEAPAAAVEPVDGCLGRYLADTGWVVQVDECRRDPGRYPDLELPQWLREMHDAWVLVPLLQGETLIAFIVLDQPPARHLRDINWEDYDLLKTCGRQAASYLALLEVSAELADARQFEAFNRLSAFVVHDLKNLVAQLSLVVTNAKRHLHSPGFIEDAIGTVDNATAKMNRLLAQLRKDRAAAVTRARRVVLNEVLEEVVTARAAMRPIPTLESCARSVEVDSDRDRLGSVIEHLVTNAQEATADDGRVVVRLRADEAQSAVIEIEDSGIGMDAAFIAERLFKPFDTTKGNAGMGVGVYESREFVLRAGGRFQVRSEPGQGTCFTIHLPVRETPGSSNEPVIDEVSASAGDEPPSPLVGRTATGRGDGTSTGRIDSTVEAV
ncbi:MAG: PEP-CTERM system histidine kinase PrsK [Gammaproteobacteria bacterium]|nr:PEP-CTERM system histidine kinase PrsK [Gammaproteobacteria bacterium]